MREAALVAAKSLVAITFKSRRGNYGSGVVIAHDESGSYVITARHVLGRCRVGAITFHHEGVFEGARFTILRKDRENDLALLKTTAVLPIPPVEIALEEPELYGRVLIVGCPTSDETYFGNVTDARITGIRGSSGIASQNYQLSAPVGSGTSGGAIINESGSLIGILVTGDDKAFISFCVSLPIVRAFLGHLVGSVH